jgi:hypothetical protein
MEEPVFVGTQRRPAAQNDTSGNSEHSRTINFVVVFWGEKFRRYFCDYCLASLMAPQNLPFLATAEGRRVKGKFIICSTKDDYAALATEPQFARLKRVVEVVLIDIGYPGKTDAMLHMSKGHKAALQRSVEEGAYCSVLAPDIILSDGSIRRLIEIVIQKQPLAFFPAFRFDFDEMNARLRDGGYLKPGEPLAVSPRQLAAYASESFHSEILRFEFDTNHFSDHPISTIFRRPGNGWVLHTSSWGLAVIDLSHLANFTDHHLDTDTIDSHFIDAHIFHNPAFLDPVVLNDSDDFLMVPLTSEADMPQKFLITPDPLLADHPHAQAERLKLNYIRAIYFSHWCDDFKRWATHIPVQLHPYDLPQGPDPVTTRTKDVMARAAEIGSLAAPLYLMVAVCNEEQSGALCAMLLPSLRAPGNVPVLAGIPGCRLVIATTSELAKQISKSYECDRVSYFLPIEFIEIPELEGDETPESSTANARILCSERCLRDGVFGSFLWPDMLLSDGAVARMVEWVNGAVEGVLINVPRFKFDGRFHANAKIVHGKPIALDGRELTAYVFEALEDALIEPEWDTLDHCYWPRSQVTATDGGFILHSVTWSVLLCDFRRIRSGTDGSLRLICGSASDFRRMLYEAYGRGALRLVADSDEVNMVSVTGFAELAIEPRQPRKSVKRLQFSYKSGVKALLKDMASTAADPLLRLLYLTPVLFHLEPLGTAWEGIRCESQRQADRTLEPSSEQAAQLKRLFKAESEHAAIEALRTFFQFLVLLIAAVIHEPGRQFKKAWLYRGAIGRRLSLAARGDRSSLRRIVFAMRQEFKSFGQRCSGAWAQRSARPAYAHVALRWNVPFGGISIEGVSPNASWGRRVFTTIGELWLYRGAIAHRLKCLATGDREARERIVKRLRSTAQRLRLG